MLIPSSWHFIDLWLEEDQSIQSGQAMEQILRIPEMNYSKDSKRWNKINSAYWILWHKTTTHLVLLIREGYGNTKSDLQELFWKDYWRPIVTAWMMNQSEHWRLKLNLILKLKLKNHFHKVTFLQWKQLLLWIHQVNSAYQICAQNEMATCTTYCPSILEQMEKGIFPEFTTCREKTDMEKDNTKPCSYCYCFAETWLSVSVATGKTSLH